MNCTCRSDIEAKLTEHFAKAEPKASNHKVALQGYGFCVVGNKMTMRPFMEAHATADFPLKSGGTKHRTIKQTMSFNYCPFCGKKVEAV